MNCRTIIVVALASLALGCDDRFIKQDVAEIRVHDIKMNMRCSVTNLANLNAARRGAEQPAPPYVASAPPVRRIVRKDSMMTYTVDNHYGCDMVAV